MTDSFHPKHEVLGIEVFDIQAPLPPSCLVAFFDNQGPFFRERPRAGNVRGIVTGLTRIPLVVAH